MFTLGALYYYQHNYAQAETLLTKALEESRRVLGEEHRDTAKFMYTLGRLYYDEGKFAQAEPLLTKALELYRHVLGPKDPSTISAKLTLARLGLLQRKYEATELLLREALNDYQQFPDDWMRYRAQTLLGESLAGQRKYLEAEPLLLSGYQGMIERKRAIPGNYNDSAQHARDLIAKLYQDWGKPEKAAEWPIWGKLQARSPFIKDGNVIQDPDAPVSFRLAQGWTLTSPPPVGVTTRERYGSRKPSPTPQPASGTNTRSRRRILRTRPHSTKSWRTRCVT